jgi:hypothetical protein
LGALPVVEGESPFGKGESVIISLKVNDVPRPARGGRLGAVVGKPRYLSHRAIIRPDEIDTEGTLCLDTSRLAEYAVVGEVGRPEETLKRYREGYLEVVLPSEVPRFRDEGGADRWRWFAGEIFVRFKPLGIAELFRGEV